ncbi:IS982 family transposase [Okeania sp. SIO1H2]|uniref:IS982 family transposase n=1 Tax=Okeania sp. SIO1H2 TaxID=2607775 RepID=UPI00141C3C65|nr:IS982 family transposase [Okeania sp. SIO1H2]NET97619.1 IS982 family transposase [Okeania sp. SIO1H2]
MFDIEEFIIAVYLSVAEPLETLLAQHPPRSRGFAPSLSDSEVVTLEIVGEFLGYHSDSDIWRYFRRHWHSWFPQLPCRTTFARQAANLWHYKKLLHQRLLEILDARNSLLYRIDGFPMPVCGFKRAPQSRLFQGIADFGSSATKLGTFYGFRGHLLVNEQGIVLGLSVTAANVDERDAVAELVIGLDGLLLGDKGYIRAELSEQLANQNLTLLTPKRRDMKDYSPEANRIVSRGRQMVETVIGHLCHWFDIETVLARDLWHLTSRLARKVLAHTLMVYLNRLNGRPALHFADMISQ